MVDCRYASRTLSGVAFEFWDQTPDLVPSILIENPAGGVYETLEGAGQAIIDQLSVKSEDIFFFFRMKEETRQSSN